MTSEERLVIFEFVEAVQDWVYQFTPVDRYDCCSFLALQRAADDLKAVFAEEVTDGTTD